MQERFLPRPRTADRTSAGCMPKEEDFQIVSDLFKLLCDRSRVRIFWLLCHCEQCVINLSSIVGMSSPAVSHHLRQLKNSGLIVSRREAGGSTTAQRTPSRRSCCTT